MNENYQILILGESWTGKSNIFTRIINNSFSEHSFGTIAVNFAKKYISLSETENLNVLVTFYDISGRKSYWDSSMISKRNINGVILVYDITNNDSFQEIEFWYQQIIQLYPNIPISLIGNKSDLAVHRKVTREEADKFTTKYSIPLFAETSAKYGTGIIEAVESLVSDIHQRYIKSITPLESFEVVSKDWKSHSSDGLGVYTTNSHFKSSSLLIRDYLLGTPADKTSAPPASVPASVASVESHQSSRIEQQTPNEQTKSSLLLESNDIHSPMEMYDQSSEEENDSLTPQSRRVGHDIIDGDTVTFQRIQQAVPVSVSGIAGGYGCYVNGVYIPTSEYQNKWPIYRRVIEQQIKYLESYEIFLCLSLPNPDCGDKEEMKIKRPAWVIKNSQGIILARCRLSDSPNDITIPPERVQFNAQGIRKDLYWEMKSSIDVFGFRKRPGGVMRPASFFQLKSLPALREEIIEISRPMPQELLSSSGVMDELQSSLSPEALQTAPLPSSQSSLSSSPSTGMIYRVILLGESGVGKTSLIRRFNHQSHVPETVKSVSVDITTSEIECLDGRHLKCQLWDTSGDHRYWKLVNVYLRYPFGGVAGVLLIYDISNRRSFEMIEYWIELLQSLSILTPLIFHLVGAKSDLDDFSERRVSFEEGIALAEKYSMSSFVETSAHDGTGVIDVFQQILTDLICFDENAKKWMKTTKPTYRRRTITLIPDNIYQSVTSHRDSLIQNGVDSIQGTFPDQHTNSRRHSFSGSYQAVNADDEQQQSSSHNINSPSHVSNLTEIELVSRSTPKS